ncbi:MAG TPA: creatininase family protein [Gammaproteobacteria bacterium]|nr:creatininase family protein [Gammaproteobacteria bacterium]
MKRGVRLETLSWPEAERRFANDPVVVFPLGAAAKEHGPHLPLNNDALIAEWLAGEIMRRLPVVVAPLINASFYPAFTEYPGSISLRAETARDLIVDSCTSLAGFGLTRFYVVNTGISTLGPLAEAAGSMAPGVRFDYLDLDAALAGLPDGLLQQRYGSHADEHETSLMLHIAPQVVDMEQAVDDGSEGEGHLTRVRGRGTWSRSGVYGQATLASADKGRVIAAVLLQRCLAQIDAL